MKGYQVPKRKAPVVYHVIVTSRHKIVPMLLIDHSVLPIKIMYGCFAKDSMVLTPNGETKVRNRYYGTEAFMIRINTCTGKSILVTREHPMQTNHGVVRAYKLNPSIHQLIMRDGAADISEIFFERYEENVYNLDIDGGCLIVNGFVTGDFTAQNGKL